MRKHIKRNKTNFFLTLSPLDSRLFIRQAMLGELTSGANYFYLFNILRRVAFAFRLNNFIIFLSFLFLALLRVSSLTTCSTRLPKHAAQAEGLKELGAITTS